MNPFEDLSDDPILHIFSYLPRNDLLKLTRMDKNFNRIITESKETMTKIPLVLDLFKVNIAVHEVTELAQKLQFRALKIKNVAGTIAEQFTPLLEHLTLSVEHLEIHGNFKYEIHFRQLIQMFLPTLKTCDINVTSDNSCAAINDKAVPNHPLKSLRVNDTQVVKFFTGCNQLKSFEFLLNSETTDCVYAFLAQQTQLKKLKFTRGSIDLSRMILVQLTELSLPDWVASEVPWYLPMLPNITKLHIEIRDRRQLYRAMKTVCEAPKLEDLSVVISLERCIPLERLENHTVKKLRMRHWNKASGWLLQTFLGVELFSMKLSKHFSSQHSAELWDPSDVPHESINKIQFEPADVPFNLTFSPRLAPVHVNSFESAVMTFAEKFSARIESITIGHNNWRNNGGFRLSNSFCEGLVKCLPNLTQLKLYNVQDRGEFQSFLDCNRNALKDVKLLHPNNDGAPKSKKLRVSP